MSEQRDNIERVSSQIAGFVTKFIDGHLNKEFHADELRSYVFENVSGYIAPGSPDRILRDLRQRKKLNYEVVSRSKSLYKALPIDGQGVLFR